MKTRLLPLLLTALLSTAAGLQAQTAGLYNLSTRGVAGTGGNSMIAGFSIPAGQSKAMLIRAAGPALTPLGVSDVLANPKIEIFDAAGAKWAENDDWSASLAPAFGSAGAFAFPAGSADAALTTTLPPGNYTAVVSGATGTSGVALVEVYDTSGTSNTLYNLSTRGQVGTGSAVLIAGLVVSPGTTPRRLLIRAAGPSLAPFGVTGLLADPKLEVYNSSGVKLAENDNWGAPATSESASVATMSTAFGKAGAFAFDSTAAKDAALLTDLPGGSYTIQVSGVNATTGLALVELYDVSDAGIVITPAGGGTSGGGTGATPTTRTWTNVSYATVSAANTVDIYLPATGNGPFPVIVWIHGGAFKSGSKSMVSSVLPTLTAKGYAVASINYRLSGEAIFPAQIFDVKAAIRFLRANAATYFLKPDKFATWGESAGAGLAALAGTSGEVATLEDLSMGNSAQSSRVQAVVDLFGPINFLTMNSQWALVGIAGQDHDDANSPESLLVGGPIQTRQALCNLYNPETHITPDDPPFFIQHGSADNLIPYLQGRNFQEKLVPVIGADKATFTLINGAGHGGFAFGTASNLDVLTAFLDKYLK